VLNGSSVSSAFADELLGLTAGARYRVTYTIATISAGAVSIVIGTNEGQKRSATGTYTEEIIASGGGAFYIYGWAGFTGTIDNVSAKLVTPVDILTGDVQQLTGADYTTTQTALSTAPITGLTLTTPANAATTYSFTCNITYSQATAAAANLWGVTTSGTAPTSLAVFGRVYTNNTGTLVANSARSITTNTSTTVVTATPSAFGSIGTTADMFQAVLWGTLEAPSNATPSTVAIAVASGSASDALTVYRGSNCQWDVP
jgi:hypothetical protein